MANRTSSDLRLGVVGNLCNLGYDFAQRLSAAGVPSRLVAPETGLEEWRRVHADEDPLADPHLEVVQGPRLVRKGRAAAALRRYDALLSVCLGGFPMLPVLGRPYVSYATGSDLREFAAGIDDAPRWAAAVARRTFQGARLVFHSPDVEHVAMLDRLGIEHRQAWRQLVDVDYWEATPRREPADELVVLAPAWHGWKPQFPGQMLKRNDILIEGFAKFVHGGGSAQLRLLRRGQDVAASEELIHHLDIKGHVRWVGTELSRDELRAQLADAHVVGDQFVAGMVGLVGLESMAAGRPVIQRLDWDVVSGSYQPSDFPPLTSAGTRDEVAQALDRLSVPSQLRDEGDAVAAWVRRVHGPAEMGQWYADLVLAALVP